MTTYDKDDNTTGLLHLGHGEGSKVERIKLESHYLAGQIAEELATDSTHFAEAEVQLVKFHGMYQQENRDMRQARKIAGSEKAYQFMVRSRIPGGVLTAEQYLVEDELADRYGNGSLRFTTRQGIQLHGILKGDLHATINSINKSLLSTLAACGDVNRNVMACPAPAANRVHTQISKIAHKIAMHLAPRSQAYHEIWIDGEKAQTVTSTQEEVEPMYGPTYLPRKFKVGIAFPDDNCIDVFTQDVGLVPYLVNDELAGFTVLIGGGMGMTHGKVETYPRLATPLCDIPADEVLKVVETIVTVQRDYGDRQNRKHARMKYVVEERGVAWFKAEVERRLGYTLLPPREVSFADADDHLGWHKQADDRWFLGLYIENGRVKDTPTLQLKTGLRRVIEQFRPGIHLTAQQNILLTDLTEEQRAPVEALLSEYGIATNPDAVGASRFAMACPALPTCGLAVAESERILPSIMREIDEDLRELGLADERISVRMTGCPNGCARPYLGDIGLVGRSKDLYNMYLGGDWSNTRMTALYATSIRTHEIAATIRPLLELWKAERLRQETFGDFCHRIGFENLRAKVESRATIAASSRS